MSCKPCVLPATIQGDMISCSMYLEALVRKPGSWEGGTTVCRSRGEQKAPAEDLLQISVCKARGDVGTIETLRATLHQESRQCHAMGAVPW